MEKFFAIFPAPPEAPCKPHIAKIFLLLERVREFLVILQSENLFVPRGAAIMIMKKLLLPALFALATLSAPAQTVVTDSVSMGKDYMNQVWYSLSDDEQGTQPRNNWDIAFRTNRPEQPTILVNHTGGSNITRNFWIYPKGARANWASVDTVGLSKWTPLYNMETEWKGAMGRYIDPTNKYDFGWGIRDAGTHYIVGDSIYIIRTQSGTYKKLLIDQLAGSVYSFTYANIDGSDAATSSINSAGYTGKNFVYFNLTAKTEADREPAAANWDMVFGQYATADFIATAPGFLVNGVLVNEGVSVAKAVVAPSARATYKDFGAHVLYPEINGIGYNWKSSTHVLNDSFVYFVRRKSGEVWKLVFTGWTSGLIDKAMSTFTKQMLVTASVRTGQKSTAAFSVVPNPAGNGGGAEIVYNMDQAGDKQAFVSVSDLAGKTLRTIPVQSRPGFYRQRLPIEGLPAGTYLVRLVTAEGSAVQQLIVQ